MLHMIIFFVCHTRGAPASSLCLVLLSSSCQMFINVCIVP